ncbi:alpha-glucan family phosphorylase [Corynebacterium epidermidicanis]|uniref:alpha-glucan family phosphorylase n=1 Tax=Corynebacterium epidermidicanis TaxID=1050174 RepID=UPI0006410083
MKPTNTVNVVQSIPTELTPLWRIAMNLRWSWRREARELFSEIAPEQWSAFDENPRRILMNAPAARLQELAADNEYVARVRAEEANLNEYLQGSCWYQHTHAEHQIEDQATVGESDLGSNDPIAAYFSMEFGIHPSLPIYSGGLGVLSGDHMKSASDLGVPLIGVGLLYSYGYFTQSLSGDGWQEEHYEYHDPALLPVEPVLDEKGQQIKVTVAFPEGRDIVIALWEAAVGRIPLLLLDTNIEENSADMREVTDRLYGGDSEHRVKQELVLGVGGVRAVNAFCDARGLARPRVAHLNEGHAGFLGLERIRERMAEGLSFDAALAQVRAANIFTTHTPVPAGIDRFDMSLVRRYLGEGQPEDKQLFRGVPLDRALALGAEADPQRFNMAHMGLRLSQNANGVAKLHGVVSREMFQGLYPGYEPDEVPIGSVTNGVHLPTWTKPEMRDVIERFAGHGDLAELDEWTHADAVSNEELWQIRNKLRADLVQVARESVKKSGLNRGQHEAQLAWTKRVLDPNVLTVGFARRVSTYKRLTLMLKNPERLRSILLNPERPVQFVIAGKAHPHDMGGKKLMQEIVRFADEAGVRDRFIFLPDYDIGLASYLISGSDIWLNNPVRPQEASGTSGMKAVMNGCLTLSISDGWWDEMPQEDYGWTIPTVETEDQAFRDYLEAEALYDLLEQQIAPMFYDRDQDGLPTKWLDMVRRSMVTLSPMVTCTRMVRDYTEQYYRPANHAARLMMRDNDAAQQFVNWCNRVQQGWQNIGLSDVRVENALDAHRVITSGERARISVDVDLGVLTDGDVLVQAVVGDVDGHGDLANKTILPMTDNGEGRYVVEVDLARPGALGYTIRVIPRHQLLASPAELGLIKYL